MAVANIFSKNTKIALQGNVGHSSSSSRSAIDFELFELSIIIEMENTMKQFIAVRAVVVKDRKVLMVREAQTYEGGTNHGKYDFPGGKVKPGETVFDAVNRETNEEVGISVKLGRPFFVDEWRPIIKGEQVQIVCIFFICESESEAVKLGADFDDYQWVSIDELISLPTMKDYDRIISVLRAEIKA